MNDSTPAFALLLFVAWSAMVAVAAHRRVRNVLLACAGAAGVATGGLVLAAVIANRELDPLLLVAGLFGLFVSLGTAFITWVAMKLGGWLPKKEEEH